jgi:hypothetical protein
MHMTKKNRQMQRKAAQNNTDKLCRTGVDVMITIFCDFWQFSENKMAFFWKTNVMIKFLHIIALFWVKNANFFAEIFGENI